MSRQRTFSPALPDSLPSQLSAARPPAWLAPWMPSLWRQAPPPATAGHSPTPCRSPAHSSLNSPPPVSPGQVKSPISRKVTSRVHPSVCWSELITSLHLWEQSIFSEGGVKSFPIDEVITLTPTLLFLQVRGDATRGGGAGGGGYWRLVRVREEGPITSTAACPAPNHRHPACCRHISLKPHPSASPASCPLPGRWSSCVLSLKTHGGAAAGLHGNGCCRANAGGVCN